MPIWSDRRLCFRCYSDLATLLFIMMSTGGVLVWESLNEIAGGDEPLATQEVVGSRQMQGQLENPLDAKESCRGNTFANVMGGSKTGPRNKE